MSFHSFSPESYWDYWRTYIRDVRRQKEAEAKGEHGWAPYKFCEVEKHNNPHFYGMYGCMQTYFEWFPNMERDVLVAEGGRYWLYGNNQWCGYGAWRQDMKCWQFHIDDPREYINWEWRPYTNNWKDNTAKIHYRKRWEHIGQKPYVEGLEEKDAAIKMFMCV